MVVVGLVRMVTPPWAAVRAPRTIFFSQAKSTPVSTSCLRPQCLELGGQVALGEQVLHALDLVLGAAVEHRVRLKFSRVTACRPAEGLAPAMRTVLARWSRLKSPLRTLVTSSVSLEKRWVWA
jgi:hypothetical protein